MRQNILWTAAIAALMVAGCAEKGAEKAAGESAAVGKPESAKAEASVDLFIMSKCPYGVQAVDLIAPVIGDLEGKAALNIDYIGRETNGQLESMHGESEIQGDIIQLCAKRIAPDKQLSFIACQNKNWREIPEKWEACATEAGIDVAQLKACKDGEEGKSLLSASFKRSNDARAMASPTIRINGEAYRGGRSPTSVMRAVCKAIGEAGKPKKCAEMPPLSKIRVVAITDKRCAECVVDPVLAKLGQQIEGIVPEVLDYSDDSAKQIMQEAGVKLLPAILFDESLDQDQNAVNELSRWLQPAGKYRSLLIGGEFDPTAEICDNGTDDTGNGKVDCADETCKEALICRAEKKGRLDVFVMSQCPYGVLGLNSMKEVLDAFSGELEFGVHYIASEKDGEFSSMHGPGEVAENMRELCAMKYYPNKFKYMDYIWCRNEDIRSDDWKKCAGGNGIDAAKIEKCATGNEGKSLHSEAIKLAEMLKIGGSPTWMVNNRYTFNGIAAADIQKQICEHNKDLKGCAKQLSGQAPGAPQGSCDG
jgi:predicted DsbA family dithiol-disulfide isomerase